jgi:transcriptional regulator with XRE-family HTH domain
MASIEDTSRIELQNLGHKARALREALGVSQEELAARAGLHRTYISQFERGHRNPTFTTLLKLAATLRVPLKHLLEAVM